MLFGPFHRVETPTQTPETAVLQVARGEVWGATAKPNGLFPCVKAYPGRLPAGRRGVEFTTLIRPDLGSSTPFEMRWYYPGTAGVEHRVSDGVDYAAIRADVVNRQP